VKDRKIVLDWSRLLGFDQITARSAAAAELSDPRLARLGSKVGSKGCSVRGDAAVLRDARMAKVGSKVGIKIGAKVGVKAAL